MPTRLGGASAARPRAPGFLLHRAAELGPLRACLQLCTGDRQAGWAGGSASAITREGQAGSQPCKPTGPRGHGWPWGSGQVGGSPATFSSMQNRTDVPPRGHVTGSQAHTDWKTSSSAPQEAPPCTQSVIPRTAAHGHTSLSNGPAMPLTLPSVPPQIYAPPGPGACHPSPVSRGLWPWPAILVAFGFKPSAQQ